MATSEVTPAYAPEDPTLPKPWTGLIDCSTGVLYYWNPETNATQYEKPGAPPLAVTSAPNLAPIPMARSQQPNNTMPQNELGQQMHQQQQQQQQQQQPPYQMPNQQAQYVQNHQAQQYPHMQMNQSVHSPYSQSKEQVMSYPQVQQQQGMPNGNQFGQPNGFPMGRELRRQEGDQMGFSATPLQQTTGASGDPHFPAPSPRGPHVGDYSVRPEQQIGGPTSNNQHNGSAFSERQQVGLDAIRRQQSLGSPAVVNPMGHAMGQPSMGPNMGYGEDQHGRGRNEYYSSSSKEAPVMLQQHPKLAAVPYAGDRQDGRMGAVGIQSVAPGHLVNSNMAPEFARSRIAGHSAIPNLTPGGPSPRVTGPSEFPNISGVDAYRKHHEITAVGDNVPAPFTTFEATGFPPEILREMRYLLVRRAYVVRCADIHPSYTASALSLKATIM